MLRVGELANSGMVARRVALLEEGTFASPSYIARHGEPRTLDDLDRHRMVAFVSSATGHVLPLEFTVAGKLRHLTPAVAVSVTAAETMVAAARLGLGLIQVPTYHLAADLAAGTLVEVLQTTGRRRRRCPCYIRRVASSRRACGVFIDWLTQEFAALSSAQGRGKHRLGCAVSLNAWAAVPLQS